MGTRPRTLLSLLGATALTLALLPPAAPAHAATFTATRFDDPPPGACAPDDCSLREAVIAANAAPGPDTVRLPTGTYALTIDGAEEDNAATGDLDLKGELTIRGTGPSVIVDADDILDRVLDVRPGAKVGITRVTITGGDSDDPGPATPEDATGGGILVRAGANLELDRVIVTENQVEEVGGGGGVANFGTLKLKNSRITANVAKFVEGGGGIFTAAGAVTLISGSIIQGNSAAADDGGGIRTAGTTLVDKSTIRANATDANGGGIQVESGGTLELAKSVVSGNRADAGGGGIFVDGGGEVTLTDVTITDNRADADDDGFGDGGGINNQGMATSADTTVVGNTGSGGAVDNCQPAAPCPP